MKTIDYIKEIKYNMNRVSKEQEKAIIEYFGEEIDSEYTEQDIYEQTRKVLQNN